MARPTQSMEDRPSKLNRSERPVREPIHGKRDKLAVKGQEAGWHYCWVNDYNVPKYEAAGYEFVTHEVTVGSRQINVGKSIGDKVTYAVGNGVTGFLMRILDEYFKEDIDTLHREVDEREATMRQQLNTKEDGRYGTVKIETGR